MYIRHLLTGAQASQATDAAAAAAVPPHRVVGLWSLFLFCFCVCFLKSVYLVYGVFLFEFVYSFWGVAFSFFKGIELRASGFSFWLFVGQGWRPRV